MGFGLRFGARAGYGGVHCGLYNNNLDLQIHLTLPAHGHATNTAQPQSQKQITMQVSAKYTNREVHTNLVLLAGCYARIK